MRQLTRWAARGAAGLRSLPSRRPWHLAVAAFAAGLALAPAGTAVAAVVALAVAGALGLARAGTVAAFAGLLVLVGAAAGQVRLHSIDAPARRVADDTRFQGRAYLTARPRPSPFGSSAEVEVAGGGLAGAKLLARASRWLRWPGGGAPGTAVLLRGTLRRPRPPKHGGFDEVAFMRRRGLAGELVLDGITSGGPPRGGFAGAVDGMRVHAESAVAAGLHREEARLLRGMVLGEDEQIQERVRDDFRASGLAHLLAVSGQNVMLLAALAAPFLGLAGLSPRARAAALLGLIGLYVPLAGAGPSLQRAGIMGAAGIVALTASRPASRSYALLLAAAGTLALNPRVAGDPGWQLSFAAVVGILVLGPPLRDVFGHGPRPLAEGLAITLAATLFTAPLLAHHFGSVPLVSLPANLLALPAVAPAMWLGMLKIALGQVAAAGGPLGPLADTAADGLGRVADPLVGYIGWLAERFGSSPGAALRLPLGRAWTVVAAYAVLAVLAAILVRGAHRAEPRAAAAAAFWRRLPRRRRLLVVVLVAAAGAGLGARALRPPGPPGALTVSFLDVGQGDATLIQDGHGAAVLFDGGPPEAAVTRLLRRAGVSRLAVVVATHQSRDHHGGLRDVIERYPVDLFLDGGDGTHDPTFRALEAAAAERHVRRVQAVAPLRVRAGRLSIQVLSPRPRPPGPPPEDPNHRAVVAVVTEGWFDLLLSADAESDALAPLDLPDVDAMKIPHHGSADPGLPKVLERLRPEMAAAEVGKDNPYGHPAPSTLAALRRARVPIYRTDRDGTVRLTVQGGGMRVSTER